MDQPKKCKKKNWNFELSEESNPNLPLLGFGSFWKGAILPLDHSDCFVIGICKLIFFFKSIKRNIPNIAIMCKPALDARRIDRVIRSQELQTGTVIPKIERNYLHWTYYSACD